MKLLRSFLFVSAVFILVQCSEKGQQKGRSSSEPVQFSDSYKAPEFSGPDRVKIAEAVRHEIDRVYKEFAEDNHLPGLVYGVVVDDSLVCSGGTGSLNLETSLLVR